MNGSSVPDYIRTHLDDIAVSWQRRITPGHSQLTALEPELLTSHLPDVLRCIADCVEADSSSAQAVLDASADEYALQRLGSGVPFDAVNAEYSQLRSVLFEQLSTLGTLPVAGNEMRRVNEALDRALARALARYTEHREAMAEKLLTMLGHDLRNPLNAACIAAEALARSEALSERGEHRLATIGRANLRIARMIEELLKFAQGHLGDGAPLSISEGDLGQTCLAVLEEAKHSNPDRTFVFEAHGDLHAHFDRERVRRAMSHLLGNAVDHGQDPICLNVTETTDGTKIVTEVVNDGENITPSAIPTLFDSFVRHSNQKGRSRGLSLYVVSLIARAHAARCNVTSSAGKTIFSILWPRLAVTPST